jgi:hypothetical protein
MSRRILIASIGCSIKIVAGLLKLIARDWQVGLLLIGFAMLLWSNIRLQEWLRALRKRPNSPPLQRIGGNAHLLFVGRCAPAAEWLHVRPRMLLTEALHLYACLGCARI